MNMIFTIKSTKTNLKIKEKTDPIMILDLLTNLFGAVSDALAGSSGPTTSCQLVLACSFTNTNNSDEPLE